MTWQRYLRSWNITGSPGITWIPADGRVWIPTSVAYLENRQGEGTAPRGRTVVPKGRHWCQGRFFMTFFGKNTFEESFDDIFWEKYLP